MNKNPAPVFETGLSKLLLLLSFFIVGAANAQNVTGIVSGENGKRLASVSVSVKGSSIGTATNETGSYSIKAGANATLIFSYIGYATMEMAVGGRTVINVSLLTNTQSLDTVIVITALGIGKQARGLGYSATVVKPEELTVNRTSNPVNALEGKVAGVNISALGTGLLVALKYVSADNPLSQVAAIHLLLLMVFN